MEHSPWERGYDDGYAAREPVEPDNWEYMDGYAEGYSEQN
jgi:hypothetical protein